MTGSTPQPARLTLARDPVTVEINKVWFGYTGVATGSWYPCPPAWWRPTLRGCRRRSERWLRRYQRREARRAAGRAIERVR